MKSVNLNKSRSREIVQWVNIIFTEKERPAIHGHSLCTRNHSVKMQCRAILCFVYGDPFALRVSYRIYIPLLPDNPSLIITLMAANFVLILWYISCHVSKTNETEHQYILL